MRTIITTEHVALRDRVSRKGLSLEGQKIMTMHMDDLRNTQPADPVGVTALTIRVTFALLLVGTGGYFFLRAFDNNVLGDRWWVMYLLIPAVGLLIGALLGYRRAGHMLPLVTTYVIVSLILFVLGGIFIFDPNWSFTQGWGGGLFSWIDWNKVWPLLLIVPGLLLLFADIRRKRQ
jgi:hypothetical protein